MYNFLITCPNFICLFSESVGLILPNFYPKSVKCEMFLLKEMRLVTAGDTSQ